LASLPPRMAKHEMEKKKKQLEEMKLINIVQAKIQNEKPSKPMRYLLLRNCKECFRICLIKSEEAKDLQLLNLSISKKLEKVSKEII